MKKIIHAHVIKEEILGLKSGDSVYITGTIYTARDAAHKRMYEALQAGESLPINIKDNIIYYMGPSPAREGRPIGSAGPTTASRMDKYTPALLELGMGGIVAKGKRSQAVLDSIVKNQSIYFAAIGGAGALLSESIKSSEVVAYDDLGTEAIRKLEVEDFPAIVVIDSQGNNLYETAIKEFNTLEDMINWICEDSEFCGKEMFRVEDINFSWYCYDERIDWQTFIVKTKAERKGINPKTKESIVVPATKVVTFKPAETLKTRVKG